MGPTRFLKSPISPRPRRSNDRCESRHIADQPIRRNLADSLSENGRACGSRLGRGEHMRRVSIAAFAALFALVVGGSSATALDLPLPLDKRSGFYSFATFTEPASSGFGGPGFGTIAGTVCTSTTATEPTIFAGNFLLDCDTQ